MKLKLALLAGLLLLPLTVHAQTKKTKAVSKDVATITAMETTPVTLAWDYEDATKVTGFKLYGKIAGQANAALETIAGGDRRSFVFDATPGQVYCYTLTAFVTQGGVVYESKGSNEVCHAVINGPVLLRVE